MSAAGWVPIEDASSAFERPAWAIRAMLERGELERRVEDGRLLVRLAGAGDDQGELPVRNDDVADLPVRDDDLADLPVGNGEVREVAGEPAASAVALASALEPLLRSESPGEASYALERSEAAAPLAVVSPGEEAWAGIAREIEELSRSVRARDVVLARAARALVAVEAGRGARSELEAREAARREQEAARAKAREPRPLAARSLVLALAVAASLATFSARVSTDALEAARDEAARATERAARLEGELASERRDRANGIEAARGELAALTATLASVASGARQDTAQASSETTALPASFRR